MQVNPQKKAVFNRLLGKMETSTFESDDIKLLFIELRPFFKKSIIFELASFFAHPEARDRGPSFDFIERNYVKFIFHTGKAKVLFEVIAKETFEKILLKGIYDFKERGFVESFGISRDKAVKLLKEAYVQESKTGDYFPGKQIAWDDFVLASNIIQRVSSTIVSNTAIESKEIFLSLKHALLEVNSILQLGFNVREIVNKNANDIFLCLVYLLHYSEFTMWDKKVAKLKMKIMTNYYNRCNKPYLYLFMLIPHDEIWISWDFMYHECDLTSHIEQDQMEIVNTGIDIESVDLYRNKDGILKIRILDYKPA